MITSCRRALTTLVVVSTSACTTTSVMRTPVADPGPSIVEYVTVKKDAGPTVATPVSDAPPEPTAAGSTVRYDPIVNDRSLSPIDDDNHSGDDELPVEDRPQVGNARRVRANTPVDPSIYDPRVMPSGIVVPYPTLHVFRGFGACHGHTHTHEAIDIGGVGPDWGVGTPIHAMARSEVVFIGLGNKDPDDFGVPDRRGGESQRGDRLLPRTANVSPYGEVFFFTQKKGRWRSGNILVTRALEGPLAGHTIRYLHIAAVHPDLVVGSIIEPGQEIALMGGTGVQESAPHLHLDIEAPDGHRLDVAPLLGLPPTASCKGRPNVEADIAKTKAPVPVKVGPAERHAMSTPTRNQHVPDSVAKDERTRPKTKDDSDKDEPRSPVLSRAISVPACSFYAAKDDFASGRYKTHAVTFDAKKGDRYAVELVRRGGSWKPKITVDGPAKGTKIQWLGTGQAGRRAYAVVEVKKAGTLSIGIGAWDRDDMPSAAAYQINVAERCAPKKGK